MLEITGFYSETTTIILIIAIICENNYLINYINYFIYVLFIFNNYFT